MHANLNEEYIEKHKEKWTKYDWDYILSNIPLSKKFIEKNYEEIKDKIKKDYWDESQINLVGLDEETHKETYNESMNIEDFFTKLNKSTSSIPEKIIVENKDILSTDSLYRTLSCQEISTEAFNIIKNTIMAKNYALYEEKVFLWSRILKSHNKVSKEVIDENIEEIIQEIPIEPNSYLPFSDWRRIFENSNISEEIIIKYGEKILGNKLWDIISEDQELSEEFMSKYVDKLNWGIISYTQKMSPKFVLSHLDKIVKKSFLKNMKVDKEEMKRKKVYDMLDDI
jgi:hypothetical protein